MYRIFFNRFRGRVKADAYRLVGRKDAWEDVEQEPDLQSKTVGNG